MRQALEEGKKYILHNEDVPERTFYISKVIGYGASCIVYDGYYRGELGRHYVRIKECFSEYYAAEERDADSVVWRSEEAKEMAFEKWEKAFRVQLAMQEKYELVNSTSKLTDKMYRGNNTLYMIMEVDNGKTYDNLEFENIHQVLRTIDALAEVVGRYHREGFLHLDIKPQNFMVLPGKYQQVKLFDFDSFVSIDDMKDGMVEHISYSGEWAAPEVRQGRIYKISEASDIYSIGMILYVTLFGHQRGLVEQVSSKKIDLSNCAWLEGSNPLLQRKLENFLEKMIVVAVSNRYQSISQMNQDLDELLVLSDPERMFLCKSIPKQLSCFVGRKEDLKEIYELLEENRVVLVRGISGVGKSELSRKYAHEYQKCYSNVVWLKCQGSMAATIVESSEIIIAGCQQKWESYKEKLEVLKTVVDSNTLFVVDDIRDFSEPALHAFLEMDCKFLITTKNYVSDLREQYCIFSLECMKDEELEELFYFNYTRTLVEEEKRAVTGLLHQIGNYTLLVPLLAKQMKNSGLLPSNMLQILKKEGLKISLQENIAHQKDGMVVYDNFYPMVRYFLELAKLLPEEEMVLKIISYFEPFYVGRKELARWCGFVNTETGQVNLEPINLLVQKGWLFWEESLDRISIHTTFREMVVSEYTPCIINLQPLQERMKQLIGEMKWYMKIHYQGVYEEWAKDAVKPCITKAYYDLEQSKILILHMLMNQRLDTPEILRYIIQISRELYFDAPHEEITKLMGKVITQATATGRLTEEEIACAYYVLVRNERLLGLVEEINYMQAIEHLNQAVEYARCVKQWKYFEDYFDYCRKLCVADDMDEFYIWALQGLVYTDAGKYYDSMAIILKNAHGTEKEVSTVEALSEYWSGEENDSWLEDEDILKFDFSTLRKNFPPMTEGKEGSFMLYAMMNQNRPLLEEKPYAVLWAFDNIIMAIRNKELQMQHLASLVDTLKENGLELFGVIAYLLVRNLDEKCYETDRNRVLRVLQGVMSCSETIGCKECYEEAEYHLQQLVAIDFSREKKKDIRSNISVLGLEHIADYIHQIVTLKNGKEALMQEIDADKEIPERYKEFLLYALQNNATHLLDVGYNGRCLPEVCRVDEELSKFILKNQKIPEFKENQLNQKMDFIAELCFQCALNLFCKKNCQEQMQDYVKRYIDLIEEIKKQNTSIDYLSVYSLLPETLYRMGCRKEALQIYQAMSTQWIDDVWKSVHYGLVHMNHYYIVHMYQWLLESAEYGTDFYEEYKAKWEAYHRFHEESENELLPF